jgi:hypothetical protein
MANHPDAVSKYRNRAEELRTFADSVHDPENRKALEEWAREYDEMAGWAAQIRQMKRVR